MAPHVSSANVKPGYCTPIRLRSHQHKSPLLRGLPEGEISGARQRGETAWKRLKSERGFLSHQWKLQVAKMLIRPCCVCQDGWRLLTVYRACCKPDTVVRRVRAGRQAISAIFASCVGTLRNGFGPMILIGMSGDDAEGRSAMRDGIERMPIKVSPNAKRALPSKSRNPA